MRRVLIVATFVVALTALAFTANSCGKGRANIRAEKDSIEYINGVYLGSQYAGRMDSTINLDNFLKGFVDVMKSNLSEEQVQELFDYMEELYTVRIPKRNLEEGEKFLAEVEKKNANVKKTDSGLLYEVVESGDMSKKVVSNSDTVKVVYEGTLKDGTVFDSSKERGDTVTFVADRVIKGWTEGLKLIGKGGSIKLWIPSELAYGERAQSQLIGPNETLLFEVDLIDVINVPVEEAEEE